MENASRSSSLSPPAPVAPAAHAPGGAHAHSASDASTKSAAAWHAHPPRAEHEPAAPGAPAPAARGASETHMPNAAVADAPAIYGAGAFAERLATHLGLSLSPDISLAAGREAIVVLDCDRSTQINQSILRMLACIHACKGATHVTAVLPYMPYSRQDKRATQSAPVAARLLADSLAAAGAHRVVVLDAHVPQIDAFFDPLRVRFAQASALECALVPQLRVLAAAHPDAVVVSPDAGGLRRASSVASALGLSLAVVAKTRDASTGSVSSASIVGSVSGRPAVVVDDIADSCGTLLAAASALRSAGCTRLLAAAVVHGLFSAPGVGAQLSAAGYEALLVSDTCGPCDDVAADIPATVVDSVPVIAAALR